MSFAARKLKHAMECNVMLLDPGLETPPPEPAPPPPTKKIYRKKLIFPPRFPLIDLNTYKSWISHRKEVYTMTHKVDDRPPGLYPELYLKPRRLDFFAKQIEQNMIVNRNLLKNINIIQRTGRSDMPLTTEMEEEWVETKKKLILGASLPFILFNTERLDRGLKDSAFDRPPGVHRDRVSMEIMVDSGAKIGRILIELFNDIAPQACALFLSLVKGDVNGHAYKGTSIFRIVPDLYCRCGDVVKNNGFGFYVPPGQQLAMRPDKFLLNHTVPGILSMAVTAEKEVIGHFNIIFKPLPQLDGKNVVFGRISSGPVECLKRISVLGMPLGAPTNNVFITSCGWFTKRGRYKEGRMSKIKFPPGRTRSSK